MNVERVGPPLPTMLVHLDIRDVSIRFALSFAVEQAEWRRTTTRTGAAAVVGDRVPIGPDAPPLDVLVVPPSPAASRVGLDAFTAGLVHAVVSAAEPASLPVALAHGRQGFGVVARSVLAAAHGFPPLSPRLDHTLRQVMRGRSNREIARGLGQSEATTKRDVTELLRRFDVTNRVALAATALRLGVRIDGRP